MLPLMMVGMALLFLVIPSIDPLKENIREFVGYYYQLVLLFFAFMLLIHIQTLLWNLGIKVSINVFVPAAVGVLFFILGGIIEKAKRNWFIGIRTPWTLSSDRVWDQVHKLGGKLFRVAGLFAFVGAFVEKYSVYFVLIPVLSIAVILIVYSYVLYQSEAGKGA